MISWPFSFSELMENIGDMLRGGPQKIISPVPDDEAYPTPTPDPWVDKGWTKAGGGYYRANEKGEVKSFVDKNKIPEEVLKRLEGKVMPKEQPKQEEKRTEQPKRSPQTADSDTLRSFGDTGKIKNDYQIMKKVAEAYNMPIEELMAQYWQESSFGQNPTIGKENEATALGPLQITRKTAAGGYPAFPDLKIDPNDRMDLEKSADFAAKHYRRLTDHYGSPKKAISAYYGDPSYYDLIQSHTQDPKFQSLMQYLEGGQ